MTDNGDEIFKGVLCAERKDITRHRERENGT